MRVLLDLLPKVGRLVRGVPRWRWVLLVALAFALTGIELVGASAIYLLLALVAGPTGATLTVPILGDVTSLLPDTDLRTLRIGAAVAVGTFFVVRAAFLVGRAYLERRIIAAATISVAERLLDGYLAMPYLFHTRRNSAELIRNTFSATQQLQDRVILRMISLTARSALVVGFSVVLVASSPAAAALAAVTLGGSVLVVQRLLQPRLRNWGTRAQAASTGSIAAVQQSLGGIRDIKLLGRERAFVAQHGHERRKLARTDYLSSAANQIPPALIELALVGTVIGLFLLSVLGERPLDEALPTLGVFAYGGLRLREALGVLVMDLNGLKYAGAIVDDLAADEAEMTAWAARVAERPAAGDAGGDEAGAAFAPRARPFRTAIELDRVTFSYAPDDPTVAPALVDVDLTIRRGEFVGICGPTGGGKSTLLDVIVGLLPPTSGTVRVDGVPLDDAPAWWWAELGVVSQQVFLTDDTLRRNIAFGHAEADIDPERLRRCIERAQLTELIERLPEGLDTLVGERGIRLSGGQRQRVAIARALYREPAVLVLDEGTSALDSATEAALVRAIDEVAPDRTLVAVAHRLQTVRHADRIVVVESGRIVDSGTYDGLLGTSALFRRLAG